MKTRDKRGGGGRGGEGEGGEGEMGEGGGKEVQIISLGVWVQRHLSQL